VELVPWFPIAAPDNSARTGERVVIARGQGATGQASRSRTERTAQALLTFSVEEGVEGGVHEGGDREPTAKDPNSTTLRAETRGHFARRRSD
jgi:hypothetical protein